MANKLTGRVGDAMAKLLLSATRVDMDVRCEAYDAVEALLVENERLAEALTPSAETKAAYIGEFRFPLELTHPRLGSETRWVDVPWTTIKEIMAAIKARTLLGDS